jgi:uncharacterized protein YegP (UPF0339 family)
MQKAQIEIYQGKSGNQKGKWRWRFKAANNEIVAHGESYVTLAGLLNGLNVLQRALLSGQYDTVEAPDCDHAKASARALARPRLEIYKGGEGGQKGKWRWRFKAVNGEIVAHGEGYVAVAGLLNGLNAISRAVLSGDYRTEMLDA